MTETFSALRQYMAKTKPYTFQPGRKSKHCIPDAIEKGLELLMTGTAGTAGARGATGLDPGEDDIDRPNAEDVSIDIDM